jgi:5-oxoprolinase (ATP-hydrolysing) subunit A
MKKVDLNADLGEGFGRYECGDDEAMLSIVSSANVACGAHAGDPEIMAKTFRIAKQRGVAVGAHPGFPDLWGFGRRRIPFTTGEIERLVAYQIGAAQALAAYSSHRITYVKPHGALTNIAETDRHVADAIARAVHSIDPGLILLGPARSEQLRAAEALQLKAVAEIYADRGYADDGTLLPRGTPGALIDDSISAASRVLEMIETGSIVCASGKRLPTKIGSVCVHGDSPHAVETARSVRAALEKAGIAIVAFT